MEDKKIKEFIKIYLDTIQHSKNIKKWIEASSRKKGDLNKSMERLENKYSKLLVASKNSGSNFVIISFLNIIHWGYRK